MTEITRYTTSEMEQFNDLTAEKLASMPTRDIAQILETQIGVLSNLLKTIAEMQHALYGTSPVGEVTNPVTVRALNALKQRD